MVKGKWADNSAIHDFVQLFSFYEKERKPKNADLCESETGQIKYSIICGRILNQEAEIYLKNAGKTRSRVFRL